MVSFSQARDMYKLQKEAKRIRKDLKNLHVEAEGPGVKVVVSGNQEVVSIDIDPSAHMSTLGATIMDCMNRAMKKAQVVSAERMQGIMGQMGMPTEDGMKGMSQG